MTPPPAPHRIVNDSPMKKGRRRRRAVCLFWLPAKFRFRFRFRLPFHPSAASGPSDPSTRCGKLRFLGSQPAPRPDVAPPLRFRPNVHGWIRFIRSAPLVSKDQWDFGPTGPGIIFLHPRHDTFLHPTGLIFLRPRASSSNPSRRHLSRPQGHHHLPRPHRSPPRTSGLGTLNCCRMAHILPSFR
jgi:hypothetical protein